MIPLIPAAQLASKLEPYKRLLGVLIRQDCISLALSNNYLNLAEPLGGLMLRDGRLSARALERLLADQRPHLSGFVVGCEVDPGSSSSSSQPPQQEAEQLITATQRAAVQQIQGALLGMSPGLAGGWFGGWSAAAASCRLIPPGGPAAAAAGTSSSGTSAAAAPAGQQERCSLGQQFLQDYLDSLGGLNTFG